MTATLRRPEAEILNQISESPLGLQMVERYGWNRSKFQACLDHAMRLRAAIAADRRGNGPRATQEKEAFRRSFGATAAELSQLDYVDRHWEEEGLAAGHGVAQQAKDAEFVAMLLVNEICDVS